MTNWHRIYDAQVLPTTTGWGLLDRLVIRRHDGRPIRCAWDVIQRIKDEMLGEEVLAIEIFPPKHELVDDVNCRHLWVVRRDLLPISLNRHFGGA